MTAGVSKTDSMILRDLAKRYLEVCADPRQNELRELWRRHNSLQRTRPLVILKGVGDNFWQEVPDLGAQAQDPMLAWQEMLLRRNLFHASLGDDTVFEPWIEEWASYVLPARGLWGLETRTLPKTDSRGSYKQEPAIRDWSDAAGVGVPAAVQCGGGPLVRPHHEIDEEKTSEKMARLREAVGDAIEVKVIRAPYYRSFRGDISSALGALRGIDNVMLDMYEHPRELHRLLKHMSSAIVAMIDAGEKAGDWRLTDHNNQSIPYSKELPDPGAHDRPVPCRQLWCHLAAQELTLVSPAMHDEFMLQYQLPIMNRFGLSAYGCCEDLTRKIDMLRPVKNLRRIAVTPVANLRKCAEQIGTDYVISWRPNPAEMVCCGWNEPRVRQLISEGLAVCRGQHVDITLKDVETVQGDPDRLRRWVQVVRECILEA